MITHEYFGLHTRNIWTLGIAICEYKAKESVLIVYTCISLYFDCIVLSIQNNHIETQSS